MLSTASALSSLESRLSEALESFSIGSAIRGDGEALAQAVSDIRAAARGHRLGRPSSETAESAARKFLLQQPLDQADRDRLAWALCVPVREAGNEMVVAADAARLDALMFDYRIAAERGELWRMTWLGLFSSYMAFDRISAAGPARRGWTSLRSLLQCTWHLLDFPTGFVPDWAAVLRDHPWLLSKDPCGEFAQDYIDGSPRRLERLERELGIPQTGWFWHDLLLAAVDLATRCDDTGFKRAASRLVAPMRTRPAGRDEALRRLLERFARCSDHSVDPRLRDFIFDRSVWKSPGMKLTGAAPVWHGVSIQAWRMAMGWLSETHLRTFFDVLVEHNGADEGRREFWSRYARQISWSRLAVGAATIDRLRRHPVQASAAAIPEEGVAVIAGHWHAVDALMIELGDYLFVEFSVNGSTCYAYPRDNLPFDRDARTLGGGTSDLKAGYYHRGEPRDLRFARDTGWMRRMAETLASLGIEPDVARPGQACPEVGVRELAA